MALRFGALEDALLSAGANPAAAAAAAEEIAQLRKLSSLADSRMPVIPLLAVTVLLNVINFWLLLMVTARLPR
jgi:hypothetical protein